MKLSSLLPFMDQEDLTALLEKIKKGEIKGIKYVHLYPFLKSSEVDELVDALVENKEFKQIYSALPFMSKKQVEKLRDLVEAGKLEGFKEEALLPFLGSSAIKALVDDIINKRVKEKLDGLDETISSAVENATKNAFPDEE
jgi:hypothetical protein